MTNKRLITPLITLVVLVAILIGGTIALNTNQEIAKNQSSLSESAKPKADKVETVYASSGNQAKPGTTTCYKLMGGKWTTFPIQYIINPTNTQGLSQSFITSTIKKSAETWDAQTSKELFNDNFLVDSNAQYGSRDNKNVIAFGAYSDPAIVAITSVWFTSDGTQMLEFDQLYNTNSYTFGDASTNPNVMDLQSITTHELGHAIGLADIYTSSCSAVTMYTYSSLGDTEKRTLENADITGLKAMYDPKGRNK